MLLDHGFPLPELSPLAAEDMYSSESRPRHGSPASAVSAVSECLIFANDATVKGGAVCPMTRTRRPCAPSRSPSRTGCPASHWSNRPEPACSIRMRCSSSATPFANQARLSAAGIPQVALVFGSSTAGGAYIPGMSDYVVMWCASGRPSIWVARHW